MNSGKKLIVVLGMHRSGTSVLARSLEAFRINLGSSAPVKKGPDNPRGYWEDSDFVALNEEIFSYLKAEWFHLARLSAADLWKLESAGFFERASELLQKRVEKNPIYGLKDPRIPRLMPFWRRVFLQSGYDVRYLCAVRHPLSVAESLKKRQNIAPQHSYFMWLLHTIEGLVGSADFPRLVVHYDRMIQDPHRELGRIARALDLEVDPEAASEFVEEFLSEDLRHSSFGSADWPADGEYPELMRRVYTALAGAAADKLRIEDKKFLLGLKNWQSEFEALRPAMMLADHLCRVLRRTRENWVSDKLAWSNQKAAARAQANALAERLAKP